MFLWFSMAKYISEGWIKNGAYEKVGLAIEKADLDALKVALNSVDNSSGIGGKANLNEVKKNADGESRSIFQVAIDAFINSETGSRDATFRVIEELVNNDKIDKSHASLAESLVTLIKILESNENLDPSFFNPEDNHLDKFKGLLTSLLTTNKEFQSNLYRFDEFSILIDDLKTKVRADEFSRIVSMNAAKLLSSESTEKFTALVSKGYITQHSISDDLANQVLDFYKNPEPTFTWEKIRDMVGKKLTPDYIIERLSDAINANSKDEAAKLIEYYNAHKAEFTGKILVSNEDLKLAFENNKDLFKTLVETNQVDTSAKVQKASWTGWTYEKTAFMAAVELGSGKAILDSNNFVASQNKPSTIEQLYQVSKDTELFSLLLKKENAVSASDLKVFLAKSIKDNQPEIAMLLAEYYLKNEDRLKADIGEGLLSKDSMSTLGKKNQQIWNDIAVLVHATSIYEGRVDKTDSNSIVTTMNAAVDVIQKSGSLDQDSKDSLSRRFKGSLRLLKMKDAEFRSNLHKTDNFVDLLGSVKSLVGKEKFKHIVRANAINALKEVNQNAFEQMVTFGYLKKESMSKELSNQILEFYKNNHPSITWEQIRELVGNKLTPDFIIERLSDAIKANSKDDAAKLLEYYNAHKAEFAGKILVANTDLKLAFETNKEFFKALAETTQVSLNTKVEEYSLLKRTTNKTAFEAAVEMGAGKAILSSENFKPWQDAPSTMNQLYQASKDAELFSLLLKKENAVSAAELKEFIAKSIKDNQPEIALLLVEYYIRNEQSLKNEIGKNLLSAEDLLLVSNKSKEKNWAELETLIQASGAIELGSQLQINGGWIYNSKEAGLDPFISRLTTASLNIAIKNGDIDLKKLSEIEVGKFAKVIASSQPQQFEQYLDIMVRHGSKALSDEIVKLSINNRDLIGALFDKGLVRDSLEKISAIELYRENKLLLLERLIDRKQIKITEPDEHGNTLLHYAVTNGHFRLAEKIVAEVGKEKINDKPLLQAPNNDGVTPLLQLLNQPYSKEKSSVMGIIMLSKDFKYSSEKIDKKIGHILNSIQDKNTAKDFLVYLEQTTKTPTKFKKRLEEIYTQALLTNNTAVTTAVLENYSSIINVNHITYSDPNGKPYSATPIFVAYLNGNVEIIDQLLKAKKIDTNKRGPDDITLLHQAALDGQSAIVGKILTANATDPNFITNVNKHPILDVLSAIEAFEAKPTLVEAEKKRLVGLKDTFALLAASEKVNINTVDSKGNTPALTMYLQIQNVAARIKQIEEIEAKKPDNIVDFAKDLASKANEFFAANQSELSKLKEYKKFLDSEFKKLRENPRVDLLATNNAEQNIVILAIKNNDTETLTATIKQNEKDKELKPVFNKADANGNTPILHAYASGNPDILALTLSIAGGSPEDLEAVFKSVNEDGQTILVAACKGGNLDLVKNAFGKLDTKTVFTSDNLGHNFLHHAVSKPDILSFLLDQDKEGVALNAVNNDGQTPLVKAVLEGNTEAVKMLLDRGADVNLADEKGNTALIYACILNKPEIINALLARPELDVRAKNEAGATAYMHAAIQENPQKAIDGNIEQDQMWTGNPDVLRALISRGAEPTFGEYYKGLGEKMKTIAIEAVGLSLVGSLTSKVLGSDSLVQQGIKTAAALRVASTTFKAVSASTEKSIQNILSGGSSAGSKIDMENQCMIGAISVGRFGRVYHGESLATYLDGQENFKNAKNSIYSTEQLDAKKDGMSDAQKAEFHETLQARYARIQTTLDTRFLPFWTRSALKNIQKEILAADATISEKFLHKNNEHISSKLGDTFSMLKGESRDRFIVGMLTSESKNEYKEFKQLLDDILKHKIYVPANVMYDVLEFNKRHKQLAQQQLNPGLFRRVFGFEFGRKPDIEKTKLICTEAKQPELRQFEVRTKKDDLIPVGAEKRAKEDHNQKVGAAVTMLGKLTGQEPKDVANGIASACGKVAGVSAAAAAFAAMDFDHAYKVFVIGSTAVGAGLSVASASLAGSLDVAKKAFNAVSEISPTQLAIGFGAAAVAVAGGYMLYSRDSSKSAQKAEAKKEFEPQSLADLSNPECKKDAAAKFLGNNIKELKIAGITSESALNMDAPAVFDKAKHEVTKLPTSRYEFAKQVLAKTSVAAYVESNKAIVDSKEVVRGVMEAKDIQDASKSASVSVAS